MAKVLGHQDKVVREYYQIAAYAPQFPVTFSDWKLSYPSVKHSPLFTWVGLVVDGLRQENMNLDPVDPQDEVNKGDQ